MGGQRDMHTPPLILIVDDEPDTVALLQRICERAGFSIEVANDGFEAIERAHSLLPDLLLLDIQMPHMDGFEVLQALRQDDHTRQIPIIMITAAATKPDDAARGINIGADDYIIKPFHYNELIARVRAKIRTKELEESLQKRTGELESLVRLGVELSRPLELRAIGEQLLLFVCQELAADHSLIYLIPSAEVPGLFLTLHSTAPLEIHDPNTAPPYAAAFQSDHEQLLSPQECQTLFSNEKLNSGAVFPLMYHDQAIGILAIGSSAAHSFTENQLRLMRSVSQKAAFAVRNAQLYQSLRAYANELEMRVEERTAALKSAQEQLLRSEKMASLGRLSGEIAHEINNPLQPIMTCLEDALEDTDNGKPADPDDLRMAIEEVKRLQRIVMRLLAFARPDSSGITQVQIREVIEEVLALTNKKIAHTKVRLETDFYPTSSIQANPDQLKQVFLNLTINAIDAMANSPNGKLEIKVWEEAPFVHVLIKDNGTGIPEEQNTRIFEPFFSTKEHGSGLGLSISHSIVEAHGGKIDVRSKAGVGTEFQISLPLA